MTKPHQAYATLSLLLSLCLITACGTEETTKQTRSNPDASSVDMASSRDLSVAPKDLGLTSDMASAFDLAVETDMPVVERDLAQVDASAGIDMSEDVDMFMPPKPPQDRFLYVAGGARGNNATGKITRYRFDSTTQTLSNPRSVDIGKLVTYLAIDEKNRRVWSADEADGRVRVFESNQQGVLSQKDDLPSDTRHVYISIVEPRGLVLTAQYGDGTSISYGYGDDLKITKLSEVNSGGKSHSILPSPDGQYAFVPALAQEQIKQYKLDSEGKLVPNTPASVSLPNGSGPRHIMFGPRGNNLYLINESNCTLSRFSYDASSGALSLEETIKIYTQQPQGATGADIHVHPSGEWLFATTRPRGAPGNLVVVKLNGEGGFLADTLKRVPTGGETPRNFAITADGSTLAVANRRSNNVKLFDFDAATGELSPLGEVDFGVNPYFVGFAAMEP